MTDKQTKILKIAGANALIIGAGGATTYYFVKKFGVHKNIQPLLFFGIVGVFYTIAFATDSMWRDNTIVTTDKTT